MRYQDGVGLLVGDPTQFVNHPDQLVPNIIKSGITHVHVKVHHADEDYVGLPTLKWWIDTMRQRVPGLIVGGWGVQDHVPGKPAPEPEAVATFIYKQWLALRFSYYLADPEFDYVWNPGDSWDQALHQGRNRRFVTQFRKHFPRMSLWFCPLGDPLKGYDYAPWVEQAQFIAPQFYENQSGTYAMNAAAPRGIAGYEALGFQRNKIKPMIWVNSSQFPVPGPVSDWIPILREAGTRGFVLFYGESMTNRDYEDLSLAVGPQIAERREG